MFLLVTFGALLMCLLKNKERIPSSYLKSILMVRSLFSSAYNIPETPPPSATGQVEVTFMLTLEVRCSFSRPSCAFLLPSLCIEIKLKSLFCALQSCAMDPRMSHSATIRSASTRCQVQSGCVTLTQQRIRNTVPANVKWPVHAGPLLLLS